MVNYNDVIICSEQPQTCPICGARTEIILDLWQTLNQSQIHECLNFNCKNQFVVEAGKEIIEVSNESEC